MRLRILIAEALLAAATLSSAASFGDYQPVDFLSDYSKLKHKAGTEAYSWSEPAAQIGAYHKVIVDRFKIYLKADAARSEIDPATMQALARHFHNAILKASGGSYQITREPGPDTLRLRIAVTDLVPNKPEASVITLAVPFGGVAEAGVGALSGKAGGSPFIGHASVEIEALDSESHQQVAAYIETRAAKKFDVDLTEGVGSAVGKSVTGYADSFSTWPYTKEAMDHWADLIGAWIKSPRSS